MFVNLFITIFFDATIIERLAAFVANIFWEILTWIWMGSLVQFRSLHVFDYMCLVFGLFATEEKTRGVSKNWPSFHTCFFLTVDEHSTPKYSACHHFYDKLCQIWPFDTRFQTQPNPFLSFYFMRFVFSTCILYPEPRFYRRIPNSVTDQGPFFIGTSFRYR